MEPQARYTAVGASVLVVLAIVVAALAWLLASGNAREMRRYTVTFTRQSLQGLEANSEGHMKGIRVGSFSQALDHELRSKGLRVQAVLPGATRTDFWDVSGMPVTALPSEIVMSAEDMVDAAMAGLDLGELVTIPALPDAADWERLEAAREALGPHLSRSIPAERYQRPPA